METVFWILVLMGAIIGIPVVLFAFGKSSTNKVTGLPGNRWLL